MITIVCGHRGTGKTSLSKRLKTYLPLARILDLDEIIETSEGKTISEIFEPQGEQHFRELEKKYWNHIQSNSKTRTFLFVGGGFDIKILPSEIEVLWLRRETDEKGRIFLNRPALNPKSDPLNDYLNVFERREQNFADRANLIYTAPEGLTRPHAIEKEIILNTANPSGFYTLLKKDINLFFSKTTYELRTDLLTKDDIEFYLEKYPTQKFLLSYRGEDLENFLHLAKTYKNIIYVDWALEAGSPPPEFLEFDKKIIISLHTSNIDDMKKLEKFEKSAYLKWSPLCINFSEVKQAIEWQQKNENLRSLLPRSENGKWAWLRTILRQEINFWRDGIGSAGDQPTLFQWLQKEHRDRHSRCSKKIEFGAVLGSPVKYSWSPIFHETFFNKRLLRFFPIHIEKNEWSDAIILLENLGLKAAAITSPLKNVAAEWLGQKDPINTLVFDSHQRHWQGFNTDVVGVNSWPTWARRKKAVLWGGEGVKPLTNTTNEITHYSSRTGSEKVPGPVPGNTASITPRDQEQDLAPFEVLIWAAPRSVETQWPPSEWPLKLIIDVNYGEDSMGKELALKQKIEYKSGAEFFRQQALAQQKIWNKFL